MESFEIARHYTILHFDDYPILFIGTNNQNQIVLGSFIYENEEENLLFFQMIVSNEIAVNFLNSKISYLNVLKESDNIFIVTKDYNENIIEYKSIEFEKIDKSILPMNSAYCPVKDRNIIQSIKRELIASDWFNRFYKSFKNNIKEIEPKEKRYSFGSFEETSKLLHNNPKQGSYYSSELFFKGSHPYKGKITYKGKTRRSSHYFKTKSKTSSHVQ